MSFQDKALRAVLSCLKEYFESHLWCWKLLFFCPPTWKIYIYIFMIIYCSFVVTRKKGLGILLFEYHCWGGIEKFLDFNNLGQLTKIWLKTLSNLKGQCMERVGKHNCHIVLRIVLASIHHDCFWYNNIICILLHTHSWVPSWKVLSGLGSECSLLLKPHVSPLLFSAFCRIPRIPVLSGN